MRDPANDALRDVGAARDDVARAERELERAVLAARRAGATWQEIGDTLAVTRQAAFKRFGKPVDPETGETLGTGPQLDPAALIDHVVRHIADGDYEPVRELMTHSCSRELTRTRVMGVWRDVLAEVGALEDISGVGAHRAGTPLPTGPVPGPFVARALQEHEAGEIACHLAVNRAGRIEGLLLAPVAAEADMAF